MAAPTYTTDLTTIATGDLNVDAGTWDESTDAGWDTAGTMVDDQNLYYNNAECVSAQYTKDGTGSGATGPGTIMYVHTTAFTIPADGAALIHHLWAAPPALNTLANGGIKVLAGTTLGDFYAWNASGSDFAPAPRGGWANYAINPAIGSPDNTVGTVTTYNMIGVAVAATAQARGNPQACNAVRYGRCEAIFTDGDISNGYATFAGYGVIDDSSTNRWNLIEPVEGGFKTQGLMSLGTAVTSVDFRDSNTVLNIRNTINVTSAFNRIEVNNTTSNVEWTAISILALGTISRGQFEVIDNATLLFNTCSFTDMGTFIFNDGTNSNVINGTTFRRCDKITTGGSTLDGCIIDNTFNATIAVTTSSPANAAKISNTEFISGGTGNGLEITGTATNITLSGLDFTGYSTTVDADKAIYVNIATGSMTINISGGSGVTASSHVRTAGAVITVSADVTVTFTGMKDNTEVRIYKTSDNSEIAGIENATAGTTDNRSFAWAAPSTTDTYYVIHHWSGNYPFYKTIRKEGYIVPGTDTSVGINQLINRNAS